MAASRAALEHGGADDAAIMQFIAAFMCGGGDGGAAGSAACGAEVAAASRQRDGCSAPAAAAVAFDAASGSSSDMQHPWRQSGSGSGAAGESDEVAVVAGLLHRLSTREMAPVYPGDQPAPHGNGVSGHGGAGSGAAGSAADAVATGHFDWAAGFPAAALAQRDTVSGAEISARVQQGDLQQQQLPAGSGAAAAEALLLGQFQWGGGPASQPQPIYPAEPEGQVRKELSQLFFCQPHLAVCYLPYGLLC